MFTFVLRVFVLWFCSGDGNVILRTHCCNCILHYWCCISPVAFDLQGYSNNRVMFNALISRLNEAIVGELTLDEAYARMTDDVTKALAEKNRQ